MQIILIILIVGIVIWYHDDKKKKSLVDLENSPITEETVFKAQAAFEKHLENTFLPDAISGKEIYIYKNLMRVWYDKLSGNNRYEESMLQKLRNDWLDYMAALEDSNTYNYLSMEEEDEKESKVQREKEFTASRKVFAIENGFASLIGGDAVKELARVRALEYGAVDRSGNLAPSGFEFDAEEKLYPKA